VTISKRFAPGGDDLAACMDQLVEVLAQLLEEAPDPAPNADLRQGDNRVIHVSVGNSTKEDQTELGSCQ
jgi:hypothetical protein